MKRCNIISGNYTGNLADVDNIINGDDLVFIRDNLLDVIKENKNIIDFDEIRKTQLSKLAKYFLRNSDNKASFTVLQDRDFINFLEKDSAKYNLKFDEKVSEKNTDISPMYSSIKKTIVSQDEQIMQILTALFKNQKVVQSNLDIDLISKLKENILIYDSTGTGKTEILKRISKLYNIPIVIEDATSLSETGYVGRNITDMLKDLCLAANGNIKLAEKGILVIDEFDKLAEKPGDNQFHVSRLGVQRSLLKLLDGTLFYFDNK